MPTFQALRAVPSLAWAPLLLLWLGIDEAPELVLIAIGAFFPVYMASPPASPASTASLSKWAACTGWAA